MKKPISIKTMNGKQTIFQKLEIKITGYDDDCERVRGNGRLSPKGLNFSFPIFLPTF